MFKRILIANRGEIAVRIIRACNDLNIESVAIYSRADRDSMHVKMATHTYPISEDPIKGYLDPDLIIQAAKETEAEAIHPGYGFLSENALFAKKVKEAGLVWIGPDSEVIAKMGDKNAARNLMIANGIPVVPGTEPLNALSLYEIQKIARKIGYPVILKASSGGGGRMGCVAVAAAKAAQYTNAGTVEFLVDDDNNFYFMEMNTRIQVEHGVTEEITGYDLIGRQIRIANGEILDLSQSDIRAQGFAIEARINAEDVHNDFVPNPGKITAYYPALGPFVRVDSYVYKDFAIPPFYDSMIAKLIVRATSYDLAVNKLKRALNEFKIRGVKTTIPFLINICNDKDFRRGNFDTSYLEKKVASLMPQETQVESDLVAAIAVALTCGLEQSGNKSSFK